MTDQATSAMSLEQFAAAHSAKDTGGEWQLESSRTLEIRMDGTVHTKVGAMIAYYGDLKFDRASTGLSKMMKSMVTSESGRATKVTGRGVLYLGDNAKEVSILYLTDDTIYCNSSDLLAYQDSLDWDITVLKGGSMFAGGLFSSRLSGTGYVAITTHGQPLVLPVTPEYPLCTDPDATVAWSEGMEVSVKADVTAKTLTGRASGETFQMTFTGNGFVVVQPFEETATNTGSAG